MARSTATNTTSWQSSLTSPVHAIGCCSLPPAATAARRFLRCPVDAQGRIVISTYPARAKTRNAERDPRVSVLVLSDDWNGPWVQVDGDADVLHMPEAADGLVDYFRCISGEHSRLGGVSGGHAHSGQVADPNHPDPLGSDRNWWIPADVAARLDG